MSGVLKAIGKVFKSVTKVVSKVVKGAFKLVKKIAPYALMIGGLAMGASFLAGGFAPGGGGLFSNLGTMFSNGMTSISEGFSSLFSGTAGVGEAVAGTAANAATAASGLSSGFLAANPTFAGVAGMTATGAASTGLGTTGLLNNAMSGVSKIGGFIKDNKELVQIGAGALQGMQDQSNFEDAMAMKKDQFDRTLAQRQEEQNWQGAIYGVNRDGSNVGNGSRLVSSQQASGLTPDQENARLDQVFNDSFNNSGLIPWWEQAYYRNQSA